MQSAEFIKYIENPQLMDGKSVAELQKLVNDFPYFQSAHILLSLASKKWDASVYQQSLRKTAVVVTNRSHLFELIHKYEQVVAEVKAEAPVETLVLPEIPVIETAKVEPIVNSGSPEESKQELDILKATELSSEPEVKEELVGQKPDLSEQVEQEMGKQLINAYLEKEVIKTPELHNPVKKVETPVSFNDWLTYVRNQNDSPQPKKEEPPVSSKLTEAPKEEVKKEPDPALDRKLKNKALIDKIIESSPGLIRVKEEQKFFTPDTKAKESLQDNEHLVTETLARIYALQGNVGKAVRAYEILSIRFPQKRAHFETLIQKLKNK
ncbi:MAG: hypothetical protein IT236_16700 [Bacteroidia bacterium]|nr:hypothetical protein [Bacteroidia bacterium]